MNEYGKVNKLTFDILNERGYVPTCQVGAGNTIYNKWGFELDIHCNFVYCEARVNMDGKYERKNIYYEHELIGLEQFLNIDKTPIMTKMTIDELKKLIPKGYVYTLNNKKKYIKSETQLSFSRARGRYKITKGKELVSEGYNDEDEGYFLSHSLLYILKEENLLPKNL